MCDDTLPFANEWVWPKVRSTMTGEKIAQQIIVILSTEFGISFNLISAMRDRASVNDVAMRTIKIVYNE